MGAYDSPLVIPAQLIGLVFVDRAGVGDFFGDAEFVQFVDDLARLHFQLPRQLIDSNLTHIEVFRLTACYNSRQSTPYGVSTSGNLFLARFCRGMALHAPIRHCFRRFTHRYHPKRIPNPISRHHRLLQRLFLNSGSDAHRPASDQRLRSGRLFRVLLPVEALIAC